MLGRRRGGKRGALKGKRRGLRRAPTRPRSLKPRTEWASATQTIALPDDAVGNILLLDDINLGQFDRLVQIARAYQYFRINYVELKWKPYQDTFISQGATGDAVPYLHWLVDTGEVLIPSNFNVMRDAGAKPIRFDDKTITVRFKPRVPIMTAGDSGYPVSTSFAMTTRKSPWLPTNDVSNQEPFGWVASKVPHKGIYYGVEQAYSTTPEGGERFYGIEVVVNASFKKPLSFLQSQPTVNLSKKKEVVAK